MSKRILARLAAAAVLALAPAVPAISVAASAPGVGLSATSLSFGAVPWQQISATQTLTVTNTGDAPLSISTIDITGQPFVPEDFRSPLEGCFFKTLAPGAQCQNQVVFQPQSGGPRSATMLIYDNAAGSPHRVSLSGTGVGAVIAFFPRFLDFGTVPVGTTSAPQTFTTVNAGDAPVTITKAALGPAPWYSTWFAISHDGCTGATLGPGGRCTMTATVTPAAVSGGAQIVNFTDNAGTGQQNYDGSVIGLNVNGGGPLLAPVNPEPDFNNIPVGATSPVSRLQVFDGGTQPLQITSLSIDNAAAGFKVVTTNCPGTTLPVGAPSTAPTTCNVDLTFTPPAAGQSVVNLVFQDNEFGGSHALTLSGRGYAPAGVASPGALDFGFQTSGTTSPSQVVTLTNPTPLPLTVAPGGVTLTGTNANVFKITSDGCSGTTVNPAGSCSVGVAFAPPYGYLFLATLSISDNSASSPPVPQTVALRGEGSSPTFTISGNYLNFGSQKANMPSAPQTITVTNTSSSAISFGMFPGTGDIVSGCSGSTAPGATCTVTVSVSPMSLGAQTALLKVFDASFNQQVVQVDYTGTSGQLFLEGPLASASFVQQVGTSLSMSALLRNGGLASLNIGQISLANNPPASITADSCSNHGIAPGTNCLLTVTATPTVVGGWFMNIVVPNDSLFGTSPAQFFIRGLAGPAPQPVFFPASVSFPSQVVGAAETTQVVWVDNGVVAVGGAQPLTISSVVLGGQDAAAFRIVWDGCNGLTLDGAYSCPVSVGFDPTAGRAFNASLVFNDNVVGSPQAVALSGTGIATAVASLSTQRLDFGNVVINSKSAPATVTLASTGALILNIGKVTISGANKGDYAITSENCQNQSLPPRASCQVVIVFRPEGSGTRSATLTFIDDAANAPQSVSLIGTGVNS